jgi:two-component system, NtrC family, response regulator HydG
VARILIVEDEGVLRLTFSEFLKDEGYEVDTAENYEHALRLVDDVEFDLIITDIIMSGKTGVDLLRAVRERGLSLPVVMITGEPNLDTATEALRLGAFDYLAKPVTREQVVRVARLALAHYTLARERDEYARRMDVYRRDLEAIFNSVKDGIVTVDAQMVVRQVNLAAAAILGLPEDQIENRPVSDVLAGALYPAREALEQTLETRESQDERRVEGAVASAGEERVLVAGTVPLLDSRGDFAGAVLTLRDITRLTRLEEQLKESHRYHDIIGKSAKMQDIFALIRDLSETDSTALICGESGTGKELVAAALHYGRPRAKGPFIRVNCAALSENILESELFGHVKGAFTGAVKDRVGRFEAARGGTILLDEIGDVTPRLQLRLLRVLQERTFERVGDSTAIKTDVRVIASTNQDLESRIRQGEFRQDLYYRLNVVRIEIPPLRDRREDIPLLIDHFRRQFNKRLKKEVSGVSGDAMAILMHYRWPGNVRELENCLERAFIVCHEPEIQVRHLPPEVREPAQIALKLPGPGGQTEHEKILTVLEQTDWNIAKSARLLGIARNTLYQKMKSLRIDRGSGQ